jgi:hypothetical protein
MRFFFFPLEVLRIELMALHMLGKHHTAELHPQPAGVSFYLFQHRV